MRKCWLKSYSAGDDQFMISSRRRAHLPSIKFTGLKLPGVKSSAWNSGPRILLRGSDNFGVPRSSRQQETRHKLRSSRCLQQAAIRRARNRPTTKFHSYFLIIPVIMWWGGCNVRDQEVVENEEFSDLGKSTLDSIGIWSHLVDRGLSSAVPNLLTADCGKRTIPRR